MIGAVDHVIHVGLVTLSRFGFDEQLGGGDFLHVAIGPTVWKMADKAAHGSGVVAVMPAISRALELPTEE